MDWIPSTSLSVKIQIVGMKGVKAKDCSVLSTNFWLQNLFLTMASNVLPLRLKQTFPPIIWIFTEGDKIESRLPFKFFSTVIICVFENPEKRMKKL